jgi:tRNA pseudouridine38-40 synthase
VGLKTWKLILEYDGTKYSGWQEQKNARTVLGQLRKAAEDFLGVDVELHGAGRTDAGVHARAQVAHLRVRPMPGSQRHFPPAAEILRGVNERLPSDVSLIDVTEVDNSFHARTSAEARTYVYQISKRRTAFFKKYIWWVRDPLDVAAVATAARMLIGRHDFICFRAPDPSRPEEPTIVVVDDAGVDVEGDLILFRITASHFLWRMVRRIVGVLVRLGKGEITTEQFTSLLDGTTNPALDVAAWTAPASGLFLERVDYPAQDQPPAKGYTRQHVQKQNVRNSSRRDRTQPGRAVDDVVAGSTTAPAADHGKSLGEPVRHHRQRRKRRGDADQRRRPGG